MSTVIMSACWPLQGMTATQKAVLISLADNANDEGVCWPSVAKVSVRTCLSERAVQGAIKWLCSVRLLSVRERVGRSTMYTLTPAAYAPPQELRPAVGAGLPPQEVHPTPADPAPHPRSSCTQNRNRTISEPKDEPPSLLPALVGQAGADDLEHGKRTRRNQDEQRQAQCRAIWTAYADAYRQRYGTEPVRNQKVNSQIVDLWKRLGGEAAEVAGFFVGINDSYLIRNCHDLGSLLAKCESYRTQWATGRQMNATTARQIEQTQANLNAGLEAAQRIMDRAGEQPNEFL
ncbi:helix-turn-helix domain-containing protein [Pseudomonas sp. GD04058]|uniref:helix-turn-helix domain-containing protein n=1 Tax=Pseudomonas sp. GD04058 TaxID=2975429 RepID=UPI00244BBE61|nr:helix-turn-helix domain-containing protein [Pseudomonas sp. GD04058]MDG9884129.1 helix-turn-helix domain-containing protein [Pseudomonas sp. GD04058]